MRLGSLKPRLQQNKKLLSTVILCWFSHTVFADITPGNSTWVYDAIFDEAGNRVGIKPGQFAFHIKTYNDTTMDKAHRLTQIYSYGGYLKMFCEGSGGTGPNKTCTKDTLKAQYLKEITAAYDQVLNEPTKTVSIMPIVDGIVGGAYLKHFNSMNRPTAMLFADVVSEVYCADPKIDGVQFNLEPMDVTQPGQANFYRQIAKNFAGQHFANKPDPYHCVDASHPHGRVFSIFGSARRVNRTLSLILNEYNNGYFIDTLYTLGRVTGESEPPLLYLRGATNEVKRMVNQAFAYPVKFQFGIPSSATMNQFETRNGKPSGFQQLSYAQGAIEAIDKYARADKNFIGTNLWAYSARRIRRGDEYTPAIPPPNVLEFLSKHL